VRYLNDIILCLTGVIRLVFSKFPRFIAGIPISEVADAAIDVNISHTSWSLVTVFQKLDLVFTFCKASFEIYKVYTIVHVFRILKKI